MSRVFRIYSNANQTITDWVNNAANVYSAANSIEKYIEDPMRSNAANNRPITSIPSPFAQIDLVKTAFKVVVDSKDLDGNTVYHQLVSNALDVAEIFFNIDKLQNKVNIVYWDKKDLNNLDANDSHKLVKHAIETYLEDGGYNFDKMDRIFMLNYVGPSRPSSGLNIIGGTSPATAFFCPANDLSYATENISFANGDRPFDAGVQPLYKRESEFFAYMYALATLNSSLFGELAEYVDLCDKKANNAQKTANSGAKQNFDTLYNDLLVGSDKVSICGVALKKRNVAAMSVKASQCDFVINSSKQINAQVLPLVLPVENGTRYSGWEYSNGKWNTSISNLPVSDSDPLDKRVLPNDGQTYPYLTMDDFLEKTIVRMGGKYDNAYFDGNYDKTDDFAFLLPLTDTFFEYFTVEDLKGKVGEDHMIKIKGSQNGVFVHLRIPVKRNGGNDFVEYKRYYGNGDNSNPKDGSTFPKLDDNGFIDEDDAFMLTLMPRVKFLNEADAKYRISLLSEKSASYSVKCYSNDGLMQTQTNVVRCEGGNGIHRHEIVATDQKNITYIRIVSPNGSGVAIPNLVEEQRNGSSFIFAVDFGTSNTHIEYQQDGNRIQPFTVEANDMQIASIPKEIDGKLALDVFSKRLDYELMPKMTGADNHFQFPFRTALCESNQTNWLNKPIALADVNIPFVYGKSKEYNCNKVRTNLKWIKDDRPRERYLENVMLVIRNKVLLNGGDLSQTKIIWSFPLSMTRKAFGTLSSKWKELFKDYITSNTANLTCISESVSPYYKHKKLPGTIATIDIGGGTTDIMVAKDGAPQSISSFRFAANDLFSDMTQDNQMIAHYSTIIAQRLNDFKELKDVMESLQNVQDNRSADLASFFFSLAHNKDVVAKTDALNFNRMLEDDENYKIIFVVFYGAIIFHLARLMQEKGLGFPRNIAFSGNGSKIINVLSSDKTNLEIFTKKIFEKVFGKTYDKDGLTIVMTDNPKEVTCEGAIEFLKGSTNSKASDPNELKELKTVLFPTGICQEEIQWGTVKNGSFESKVVKEIDTFMSIIFDLANGRNLDDLFGINNDSLEIVKKNYKRDMDNYIKREFDDMDDDEVVDEPIFFFPFRGMLSALQAEITKMLDALKND